MPAQLSQYGIKCRYKRNYTYKCQVEGCPKKFNNVGDWNKHHRSRHSSITYTCEKCGHISSSPIQHRDHIYLHKETQFTCGRCYKSLSGGHEGEEVGMIEVPLGPSSADWSAGATSFIASSTPEKRCKGTNIKSF